MPCENPSSSSGFTESRTRFEEASKLFSVEVSKRGGAGKAGEANSTSVKTPDSLVIESRMARNVSLAEYAHALELAITNAVRADAPALTALRVEVARRLLLEHGGGPWSACPSRAIVLRQMRASHMLVARRGEEIVGTVRLIRANPMLLDASAFTPVGVALYLIGLAVEPQARAQGIGRELVETCKRIARSWPAQALWLDTYATAAGAGRFYEKCGFRQVGPTMFKDAPMRFYEWRTDP